MELRLKKDHILTEDNQIDVNLFLSLQLCIVVNLRGLYKTGTKYNNNYYYPAGSNIDTYLYPTYER